MPGMSYSVDYIRALARGGVSNSSTRCCVVGGVVGVRSRRRRSVAFGVVVVDARVC